MAAERVLVVDDEPMVAELLAIALTDHGFVVDEAHSAQAAFFILGRGDPVAAVVTDINLGRGQPTGWEVGRKAREIDPSIKVVYVSGDSGSRMADAGVAGSVFAAKPYSIFQIGGILESMVRDGSHRERIP